MPKAKKPEPLVNPATTPATETVNPEVPAVPVEAPKLIVAPPKKLDGVILPRRVVMPNGTIREDF